MQTFTKTEAVFLSFWTVWMAFRIPSPTSGSAKELKPFCSIIIMTLLPVVHGHSD